MREVFGLPSKSWVSVSTGGWVVVFGLPSKSWVSVSTGGRVAGLAAALSREPDLVILDWMMPGLSGVEVCRAIRADPGAKNIPVLMLTAKAHEADIDQAFTVGADDYMVKPFRGRELVSRVQSLTAKDARRV